MKHAESETRTSRTVCMRRPFSQKAMDSRSSEWFCLSEASISSKVATRRTCLCRRRVITAHWERSASPRSSSNRDRRSGEGLSRLLLRRCLWYCRLPRLILSRRSVMLSSLSSSLSSLPIRDPDCNRMFCYSHELDGFTTSLHQKRPYLETMWTQSIPCCFQFRCNLGDALADTNQCVHETLPYVRSKQRLEKKTN